MGIKLSNNAFATLAAGINSSVTSITVTSGQGARFPTLTASDYFYATLIDTSNNLEIVKCTARSTDVLTVVRAQESTTARAYSAGDRLEIRITAATFVDSVAEKLSLAGGTMTGQLTVGGLGGLYPSHVVIQPSTDATSERAALQVDDWYVMQDSAGTGTKDFSLYKATGLANHALKIDTSGRMTTPYKPMLRATVSGASNITFVKDADTTIPFNYKNEFTGSDFNTSTYTFTCPVAGVYFVHAAVQVSGVNPSGGVGPNLFLKKNGGGFSGTYHVVIQSAPYQKLESTGLTKCSAGDTIAVSLYQGNQTYSAGSTEFAGDMRNGLYICLLG